MFTLIMNDLTKLYKYWSCDYKAKLQYINQLYIQYRGGECFKITHTGNNLSKINLTH